MDIETIKTVLLVARTGSFNDAAYLVPCSQSSVSRRVDAAETELKIKIFIRPWDSPDHRIHLTSAGEKALVLFKQMMDDYQRLLALANEEKAHPQPLSVGVRRYSMPPMAFSTIKSQMFSLYPNIYLDFISGNVDDLIFDLKNNRLEAVILCCSKMKADQLQIFDQLHLRLLGKVPMSVGASEKSPLASHEEVRMIDLKDEVFLLQNDSSELAPIVDVAQMKSFIERAQRLYGFTPKTRTFSENRLDIRYQLTMDGKGIFPSFTPKVWRNMPGIKYIPIAKKDEHCMFYYLLSRSGQHEHELRLFADYFSSCISESDG